MTLTREFDVVVIGAGIAGLVAAVELQRAGVHTLLIEERDRVGGLLASTQLGDLEVDSGAESFATRNDAVAELMSEVGVALSVVSPNAQGAMLATKRRSGVARVRLPKGTVLGIPGRPWAPDVRRSIGVTGAFRAVLDGVLPRSFGANDGSLGVLVKRRMGNRAHGLVDSICRSVYSTPASEVDVDLVAPNLRAELLRRGSLARAVRSIAPGNRPGSAVEGLDGGLWQLAPALVAVFEEAGGVLWIGTSARTVSSVTGSVSLDVVVDRGAALENVRAQHLVLAVPGPAAAKLLAGVDSAAGAALDGAEYRGVTVACVRLTSSPLDGDPIGTGVIAAKGVGSRAKALTHMNAKWGWLAETLGPHEHVVRLSFDGTSAETVALAADPAELAVDLSILTGVDISGSDITDVSVSPWPNAVVPLTAGQRPSLQTELLGVTCVGSWVAGTGLASVIPHARGAAGRIIRSHRSHLTVNSREGKS